LDGYFTSLFRLKRYWFYSLVQKKLIHWELFSSATLSRFDFYYSRNNTIQDKLSIGDFFEDCQRKLKQTNKNVGLEKNYKGWILKIRSRRSNNYSWIYETNNSLKFEHEIKEKFLQKYHLLLVENHLEEFEQNFSKWFLLYFGKLLPLNYSYPDWLIIKLRPIQKYSIPQSFLNIDYIESKALYLSSDPKKFVMLF